MKWRISGPVQRDLNGIWIYTASTWGVEQADRYVDALTTRMIWLSDNPKLWVARDETRRDIFSYDEGRHVIFFEVTSDILSIVCVLHYRMDVKRHIG